MEKEVKEKWSQKYKDSIDCDNPKGFSQKAHCQGKKKNVSEIEKLKGGLSDKKTLKDIAIKHTYDDSKDSVSKDEINKMISHLEKQIEIGMKVEMEHTKDKQKSKEIAMDHLYEDPNYYTKLNKMETKEMTGADSSGSFVASMGTPILKKELYKQHNTKKYNIKEEEEIGEATDASSSGSYDVPLFAGKKRKNPLQIDGEKSLKSSRAVTDKKFPKWGGPGGMFIKIKEKCKKYPYCNQGDINAIELLEIKELNEAVKEISEEMGIPYKEIEKIVLNEIKQIFI